ncbi:MAG: amidohydrolase [Dehalococcoidales bacterium]|nr:amidohydrolase [Dehalococcoidales bacterium]
MQTSPSLKIDAYSHISPPGYTEFVRQKYPVMYNNMLGGCVPLYDMDHRFRIMDRFEGLVQVLTIGPVPPIEDFADAQQTVELSRMANDEMAELVLKHRDRFITAIALLPMNNPDAAVKEAERAITELGFRGIYVHSNINGKPLDSTEFMPLWEMMAGYHLPVYIHPWRSDKFAEYPVEESSKYAIASTFGWPFETTAAMARIVFSGILEKYPDLKIVTHHCGGMIPYYQQRIYQHYGQGSMRPTGGYLRAMSKTPLEYFKMFYNDTAIHGNTPALMCAYDFCGADHIVFGADMPLGDYYFGMRSYRQTINAIEAMDITAEEKKKIFVDNTLRLLRIPL